MKPLLDRLYAIVDSADMAQRLVPQGLKTVQLRMKLVDEATLRANIRAMQTLCRAHNTQLIINDAWQVAMEEGCNFVHLGQEDLDHADVHALRAADLRIGVSTHDEAELARALSIAPDYIALGPIYPTQLKVMKWVPQGLLRITQWKAAIGDIPLVAIGGLTPERIEGVFAAGADSVAVITDIVTHPNPELHTRAWIGATRHDK